MPNLSEQKLDLEDINTVILDLDSYTDNTYTRDLASGENFAFKITLQPLTELDISNSHVYSFDINMEVLDSNGRAISNNDSENTISTDSPINVDYDGHGLSTYDLSNGNYGSEIYLKNLYNKQEIFYILITQPNSVPTYSFGVNINKNSNEQFIYRSVKNDELTFEEMDNNLNYLLHLSNISNVSYKNVNKKMLTGIYDTKLVGSSNFSNLLLDSANYDGEYMVNDSSYSNIISYINGNNISYVENSNIVGIVNNLGDYFNVFNSSLSGEYVISKDKNRVSSDGESMIKLYGSYISGNSLISNNFHGLSVGSGHTRILNPDEISITNGSDFMERYTNHYKAGKCTLYGKLSGDTKDSKIFYFIEDSLITGSGTLVVKNTATYEECVIKYEFVVSVDNHSTSTIPDVIIRNFTNTTLYTNMPEPTIELIPVPNDPSGLNGIDTDSNGVYGVSFGITGENGEYYTYQWAFDYNSVSNSNDNQDYYSGSSSSSSSSSSSGGPSFGKGSSSSSSSSSSSGGSSSGGSSSGSG